MIYEIDVVSQADLFREGLNSVAAFCSSEGFRAVTWMGSLMSILITALAYMKQHDLMVYLKWLALYCFVFNVLLGIPTTVAIINTSDQTVPAQLVDHVPFGLAFPAHWITVLGHGIAQDLETVFALPSDLQYQKTGFLFGSQLFQLSLASRLDDPALMNQMNQYVRNCVMGDMLINHKYTWQDVLHSNDLWGLISKQSSSIRGVFIQGHFQTCRDAAQSLTQSINHYSREQAPAMLARFIPTKNHYAPMAISNLLMNAYHYFQAASDTGVTILKQNIAINAFRLGIQNYAQEMGSIAGLENITNTITMNHTRLAWATSRHIGIQTLPLMHVVLLLLLLCLFPFVVILIPISNFGWSVFKNYLYSLLWLETWPMLYAILNMAMNFYLKDTHGETVTLSNINLLAETHSDVMGIAGYLVLAIPFLSLGIVKGMAFTFNNAAQYLGGMMHSIGQSSAASVASGNYSLGNISMSNATANTNNF